MRPQQQSRARQLEAARQARLATAPPPASHHRQFLQAGPELEQERALAPVPELVLERVLELELVLVLVLVLEQELRPAPYLATLPQPQVAFSAQVQPSLGSVPPLSLRVRPLFLT